MRVRSAPFLPGASPMNITRAAIEPFKSLNTALRPHIEVQRVQAAASLMSVANTLLTAKLSGTSKVNHRQRSRRNSDQLPGLLSVQPAHLTIISLVTTFAFPFLYGQPSEPMSSRRMVCLPGTQPDIHSGLASSDQRISPSSMM